MYGKPERETVEQCAQRLEFEHGKKLADYPYDPDARVWELRGLDKLKAVADEGMRRQLWSLYWGVEAQEALGIGDQYALRQEAAKRREETETLTEMARECLNGQRGAKARDIAKELLRDESGKWRTDLVTLRHLKDEIHRLRKSDPFEYPAGARA